MDGVIVDTDVFSYLYKRDTRADVYRRHLTGKTLALTFITVGELFAWADIRTWGERRRADLESRLRSVVIIPFDLDICREYGKLCNLKTAEGSAINIAANDRWIAACALRHDLPLVTNNRRHFEGIPHLKLLPETARTPTPAAEPRLPLDPGKPDVGK
jgi:tRNA(fMet)-specific endonuclease VapC